MEGVRAAAAAEGKSLKQYMHDLGVREMQRKRFVAGAASWADRLRAEFDELLQGRDPASVVHQCGSGVSALPNLIAMEVAGYAPTRLFAGSWSEWCSDTSRPVERG